jgi:hypothetical protein
MTLVLLKLMFEEFIEWNKWWDLNHKMAGKVNRFITLFVAFLG